MPSFLDAKQRASRLGNRFVLFKIMHALALALVDAGQLRLAYLECLSGLDLLKQSAGSARVAWHFSVSLAIVLYQWNRLEEAGSVLRKMIHDAATRQQSDVQAWGYHYLLMIELAAGDLAAAQQALQEGEHLALHQGFAFQRSWLTEMRVRWWLAQGNLSEASDWAAHVIFPLEVWAPDSYEEFLLLIRLSLAQQQWTQAVEALERFSSHLDRPGNIFLTISFLSLYTVALHQAGKTEQARTVAVRLCALTEPEGYLRVYLDVGKPMKQTLQSFLTTSQDITERTPALSHSYISRLLAAFEQEEQIRAVRADAQPARPQAVSPPIPQRLSGSASSVPALLEPLTPQEQRVLHLLAGGASNQQIANQLVIQLATAKKHVTNLLGKLGAANRTQAIVRAREYGLL